MKKCIKILCIFMLIILLSGCGKTTQQDITKKLEKKINKLNSYKINGTLEITNNDDTYQYDVTVDYKKDNNYKISLINKSNNHEQIILKNNEGVYVVTPSLNKSFKFQSDWPNNNSQIYLLKSLINDIKKDEKARFEQKDGKYEFTTTANYPNNSELKEQKIVVNKKLDIEKVEVLDNNGAAQMTMIVKDIDYDCTYNDDYFDLDHIIEKIDIDENNLEENQTEDNKDKTEEQDKNNSENKEQKEQETSTIDDVIYPLYIPTGTTLSDQEKVTKTDGERIILTFDGEKPFLLVEENSSISEEFNIIPTFGEPFMLTDTIAALSDNSITWSSNGIDYYIVSETMSQNELIEIASSITAIPTIK